MNAATALRICQEHYDNLDPECPPTPWIETPTGKAWLDEAINSLILGLDVTVSLEKKIVVTAKAFIEVFSEQAVDLYADDETYTLEWALARGHGIGWPKYQELARNVARELLEPHFEVAAAAHEWLGVEG